jgi:VWFA-related protein
MNFKEIASMKSFALALCAALSLPFSAFAQQAPAATEEPPLFGEMIDVRVVNVEAVVTDKAGQRVGDLKAEDFRLRVDGKEVPIAFFTEVREGQSVGSAGAAPGGAAPGEAVGTGYLVFIDEYFSTVLRRNEILEALKKDLGHLGPKDKMAIVAFDGARLSALSGWTGSVDELRRVLDGAKSRPARGLDRITELRSFQDSADFSDHFDQTGVSDPLQARTLTSGLSAQEHVYGDTLVRQIDAVVSGAVSAMRGASPPSGRKVMLLLSGGWPFSVQGFIRGDDNVPPSRELPDGESLLRPLTSTANLLGFTIYPVDVPGIETGAADAGTFAAPAPGKIGGSLREQEVEGSLSFIAQETGGRPLLNSNRDKALTMAADDVRSYYWLGFTPTWERNDKRHKVEVIATRPGLRVRSRNSFLDLSTKAAVSMRMESALMLGSLPDGVPMPMKLGAPVKAKGMTEIPITLGLPVSALTIFPVDGQFRAQVELRVAAADENGNRSDVPVLSIDLHSPNPPKAGGFVRYQTSLKIRGQAKHIVVATYDPLSGKIATAEADVP